MHGVPSLSRQFSCKCKPIAYEQSRKTAESLESEKRECKAIIDTPKGRRNKFRYDAASRLFGLGGVLAEGLSFPHDFGFIPSTLAEDGDPLDVMVLMDEPLTSSVFWTSA